MSAMKGILEQAIHKIPGQPVIPKSEKQGYVDLKQKTKVELLDLIERQDKLLKNKAFVNRLPDKGAKITDYRQLLVEELKKRDEADQLAGLMSRLNVNGKEEMDKLEWTGSCNPGCRVKSNKPNDDDDEGETDVIDPLKLIATHSGTTLNRKIERVMKREDPLIKSSDLEGEKVEEDDSSTGTVRIESNLVDTVFADDPYVKTLCEKFDGAVKAQQPPPKERFLPHRTLQHKHEEKRQNVTKKQSRNWEVTAATPPPPVHGDVKLVSLHESVQLQLEQAEKLKEIQIKNAAQKLTARKGAAGFTLPNGTSSWTAYRENEENSSSSDDDEKENEAYHDCVDGEDEDDKAGGVVFYNLIDN